MATSLNDLLYEFLQKITSATEGATEDLALLALLSALDPSITIPAENVTVDPSGGLEGDTVAEQLAELDTEKVPIQSGYILGQYDVISTYSPADGGTVTHDCNDGNSIVITAPDTGAGMDFTITLTNVPTGKFGLIADIIVGTNVPTISYTNKGANVTAPTLTANRTNQIVFTSRDAGTTIVLNSAGNY